MFRSRRSQVGLLLLLLLLTSVEGRRASRRRYENDEEASTTTTTEKPTEGFLGKLTEGIKKPTTIATALLGGNRDLLGNTLQTLFTTVDSCIGSKSQGWQDEDLGDFTTGPDSPYCNKKCYRSFFCCPPQKPDEIDPKFIFSSIVNGQARHVDICVKGCPDTDSVIDLIRSTDNPLLFFVHGLINDIYVEPIYNQTRDALLARGFDVILVDWHLGNRLYLQSMANVRTVGAMLGQLIHYLGVADRTTCTGFSLGAHICGEAANYLKKRNEVISKCEGIDPAGPGFDGCSPEIRLDKDDCTLVTVMHTSAFKNAGSLLFGQGFGTTMKSGNCDYWVNDGMDQPQCDNGTLPALQKKLLSGAFGKFTQDLEWAWECSHYRAVYYYLSQARRDCNFIGREGTCGGGVACTNVVPVPKKQQGNRDQGRGRSNTRNGTQKTGMRGKRSFGHESYPNDTYSSLSQHEAGGGRQKRGLIKSFIKGTGNFLGLRHKKTKEERDQEHANENNNQDNDEEGNSGGRGNRNGQWGRGYREPEWERTRSRSRSYFEHSRFNQPSYYRPGLRDDPYGGYGGSGGFGSGNGGGRPGGFGGEYDRPDSCYTRPGVAGSRGSYGGGGGRRPDWLEGGSGGGEYGREEEGGYGGPHRGGGGGRGGSQRPGWLEGGNSREEEGYDRPGSGSGYDRPGGQGGYGGGSGGGRPEEGGGQGSSGEPLGGTGSEVPTDSRGFPEEMPLMPDDTCKPSYDVDYKFITKGTPPFC